MSITANNPRTTKSILNIVESSLVKKLYAIVQSLLNTSVGSVYSSRSCMKSSTAHTQMRTASLFISNRPKRRRYKETVIKVDIQKCWQSKGCQCECACWV